MCTTSHPILLAALDLDGTLLNSNGEVSPCTQKVLSEASDRGVVVIPATGRPLASLPPVVAKQPGCIMPSPPTARRSGISAAIRWAVSTAGMPTPQSMRRAAECIVRRCFPVEKAREVYETFQGLPGGLNIFSDGRALRDMAQQRFFRRAVRPSGGGEGDRGHPAQRWPLHHPAGPERVDEPPRPRGGEVLHVLPLGERGAAVSAPLYGHRGVEVVQGAPDNIEVTAAGVNKGESLLALADHLGIPREATLAVGDSENDRAMLEKAGVAAVMANGMEHIRKLADIVSENDNDHDGVAEIFARLGL